MSDSDITDDDSTPDILKIDTPLAMAMTVSDGPFIVLINWQTEVSLTRNEIYRLITDDEILSLELDRRVAKRRWKDR